MADSLSSVLGSAIADTGVSVQVRSRITPPLNVISNSGSSSSSDSSGSSDAAGGGGGSSGGIVPFLQPAVDIIGSDGTVLTTIAPFGDPGNGLAGGLIAVGIVVTILALAFMAGAKWG